MLKTAASDSTSTWMRNDNDGTARRYVYYDTGMEKCSSRSFSYGIVVVEEL